MRHAPGSSRGSAGTGKVAGEPLISIIVTNFNYARFLGRAIESAVNQDGREVEVVVVDDASTDGSREIIARYGCRIVPVLLPRNGGNQATFNAGFAASHGRIVLFLDSDDALYPGAADAIAAAWRDDTAKVHFYLDAVDAEERPLGFRVPNIPFCEGQEVELLYSYGYYPSPPTSGNAYAREVLDRILPLPNGTWRMGADGLLNALAALDGPVVSLQHSFGFYRHHDRNESEASGVTLAKIRRDIRNEAQREAAIRIAAQRRGRPIEHPLSLRIPAHCKGRFLSLRLDPEQHPFGGDGIWRLVASGMGASWHFPHYRRAKRFLAILGFAALPFVPASVLKRHLDAIMVSRKRRSLLSGVVRYVAERSTRMCGAGPAPPRPEPTHPPTSNFPALPR
jgi:hypothetical protein